MTLSFLLGFVVATFCAMGVVAESKEGRIFAFVAAALVALVFLVFVL